MADRKWQTGAATLRVSSCAVCPGHESIFKPKKTPRGFVNELQAFKCNPRNEWISNLTGIDSRCGLPLWDSNAEGTGRDR